MTPAEFFAKARGCAARAKQIRDDQDALNATLIAHIRAAQGDKDAHPAKFLIFGERKAKEAKSEAELEEKLMRIGGGKPDD